MAGKLMQSQQMCPVNRQPDLTFVHSRFLDHVTLTAC